MSKITALIWSGVGLGVDAGAGFGAAGADFGVADVGEAFSSAGAQESGTQESGAQESGVEAGDIQTRCVIHNHFLSKLCKSLRVLSNATDLMNSITTPPQES